MKTPVRLRQALLFSSLSMVMTLLTACDERRSGAGSGDDEGSDTDAGVQGSERAPLDASDAEGDPNDGANDTDDTSSDDDSADDFNVLVPNDDTADDDTADDDTADDDTADDDTADDDTADDDTADDDTADDDTADDDTADDDVITPAFPSSWVGGRCQADEDCDSGLSCLTQSDLLFPGEIAEGWCTAPCNDDPVICDQFANPAVCFGTAEEAFCLEACVVASSTTVDSGKCSARISAVCTPLPTDADGQPPYGVEGLGLCTPDCFSDALCSEGAYCNPVTGLCQDSPPTGLDYGQACEVGDDASCLGGICLQYSDAGDGVCSGQCTFTPFVGGCGPGTGGDDPPTALCVPLLEPVQYSDPGLCVPTCDVAADCAGEMECVLFDELETQEAVGRAGTCAPPDSE